MASIAFALSGLVIGCTGDIEPGLRGPAPAPGALPGAASDPTPPGQAKPNDGKTSAANEPACDAKVGLAPARLWRITDDQYVNIVHQVFGANIVVDPNVSASRSVGGDEVTVADSLGVPNDSTARNYFNTARAAAASAVTNLATLVPCQLESAGCVEQFIRTKVARAFRRPVSDIELHDMLALYQAGASDGPAAGMRVLMEYVLQAPSLLWRAELGADQGAATRRLGAYELASALSFLFLDTAPDDVLWASAESGALTSPAMLAAQIERLSSLPAAKTNIARKLGVWLGVRKTERTEKDQKLFPEFTVSVKEALGKSTSMFLEDIATGGAFQQLLSSPKMYVNKELATLFGIPGTFARDLVQVTTNSPERSAGILTQPGILAANSRPNRADPIHRGLFIYNAMVCGFTIPDPPANAGDADAMLAVDATERERAEFRASRADCSACHRQFDPLGLLSERYDPLGRYRERDASGTTIDDGAVLTLGGQLEGQVTGLVDLSKRLLGSRSVTDCTASHLVSIAIGEDLRFSRSCALNQLKDSFAKDGNFVALFRALAASQAFQVRDAVASR
ncbi:MAG TPA: DUF1592 domain-containing protein [Polyangia bacterium]